MRKLMVAALLCAVAPFTAGAQQACLNTIGVLEKVQRGTITAAKLTEPQIEKLRAAFAEAHPGQKMADGNHALVFHREDAPGIDWLILFQDGCAKYELPIESELVGQVMDGDYLDPFANPGALEPASAP